MYKSRDPSFEAVYDGNRELVVESDMVRPVINFPQSQQVKKKYRFQKKRHEQNN